MEVGGALRSRLEAKESGQHKDRGRRSEVRDQTSEVRVKLISDLRLLTSVIDDFNDLNGLNDFYDFYGFNDLPLTARSVLSLPALS